MPAIPTVGSKAQVFHGTAQRTAGGLKQGDLMKTDKGRIVSKKQHNAGLNAIKRLRAAGFVAKKGEFTLFKKRASKSPKKSTRKMVTRAMAASRKSKAAATRAAKKSAKSPKSSKSAKGGKMGY
jgi:hypothetical protein